MSVGVKDINTDFLPLIYEIIRSIEKESHDNSTQQKIILMQQQSGSDVNAKMQQLRELFTEFRATVPKVPGIGTSKEEQIQLMMSLRQQLIMKKELLMKYKNSSIFDNLSRQQQLQQQSSFAASSGDNSGSSQ